MYYIQPQTDASNPKRIGERGTMSEPAPRGRPSEFTQEIADRICAELAEGKSLLAICKADDLPPESTVRGWVVDDREGFSAKYTRARDIGLDCRADRIDERIANETDTQRARLLFDHDRWYLSKLAPKRYGDKVELAHTGGFKVTKVELTGPEPAVELTAPE